VTEIGGGFLDDGVRTTGIGRASDLISSTNSLADKISAFHDGCNDVLPIFHWQLDYVAHNELRIERRLEKRSSRRSPSAWGRRPYTDDDSRRPLLTILGGTLVHNWKYPGQPFRRKRIWSSSFTKHAPRKSRTLSSPCALLINSRRHRRQKLMQSQAKVDSATVRNLSSKIRVSVQYDVTKACRSIQKRTISRLRKDRILEGLKLC
jgi:hypothetical protein